jgi:hypothetical protein
MDDREPEVIVIHSGFNPTGGLTQVTLPQNKEYHVLTFTGSSDPVNGLDVISGTAFVPARTTMILTTEILEFQDVDFSPIESDPQLLLWIGLGVGIASLVSLAAVVFIKRKQPSLDA